ncbi:MAG: diaminopimelate epimerase [Proteobacteria bacterium]|nr:MAG: diaminopimelate epimerase [Pseudomonadota bacterium]
MDARGALANAPPRATISRSGDVRFIKYHGLGNDFVVLEADGGREQALMTPDRARRICRRGFGVGADGLMVAAPAIAGGHLRMWLLNSDGSTPQMCGNGIRCFVKYAVEVLGYADNPLHVETPGGIKACAWRRGDDGLITSVRVDMGAPCFERRAVPVAGGEGEALNVLVEAGGRTFDATGVNTGNPHMVIFGDADRRLAETLGPELTAHPMWPEGANVEFAELRAPDAIAVSVWERGCGLTEACGTGATATAAAAVRLGLAEAGRPITVTLPGGSLEITIEQGLRTAWMEGPAVEAYRGVLSDDLLA